MAKYKNTKNQSTLIKIIAVVLVLVLIAYLICSAVYGTFNLTKWGRTSNTEQTTPSDDENTGGLVVTPDNGISLMSLSVTPRSVTDTGTGSSAISEYDITAEITPSNATYQAVDWAIDWDLSAITDDGFIRDGWDSVGNTADLSEDDYVAVTTETDGALNATVNCYQPFGCPLTLTCTSRDNPEISATCRLDFQQEVTSVEVIADDIITFTNSTSIKQISAKIEWGVGTLPATYSVNSTIKMYTDFSDWNEYDYDNAYAIVGTYKNTYIVKEDNQSFTTSKNSTDNYTCNLMSYDVAWSNFAPTYLFTHDSSASDIQKLANLQIAKNFIINTTTNITDFFWTELSVTYNDNSVLYASKGTNINNTSLNNVSDTYTYVSGITLPENIVFTY